jgi:hypothetical protein
MTQPSVELQELLGKLASLEVFAIFMTPTEEFLNLSATVRRVMR